MKIASYLQAGTSDSITRLGFFILLLWIIAWQTYAVLTKTVVPNLIEILGFAGIILGHKQWREGQDLKVRMSNVPTPAVEPEVQQPPSDGQ